MHKEGNIKMKRTDLAYAAGIIDGEGCIGLYTNSRKAALPSYQMSVRVRTTDGWLCQWLALSFGGGTFFDEHIGNRKDQWVWFLTGNKALPFLELVLPYLRLKKPEAELAIHFQSVRKGRGRAMNDGERALAEAQRILMANLKK